MQKILPCTCHKVTSDGNVWTKIIQFSEKGRRGIQTKIGTRWNKMSPTKTKSGYYQTILHGRVIRINRLIATNFIPNPLAYNEVHHINDIKTDNRLENLRWGNASMNAKDRRINGHQAEGSKSVNAKLDEKKVLSIRKERNNTSLQKLATRYDVSKKLILLVCQNKIWKHVK